MVDLHCHSNCSDGSDAPLELLRIAHRLGLKALSITDHDTLEGYDLAASWNPAGECILLCGVELSTRSEQSSRSVHLLGYFLQDPGSTFRAWLSDLQQGRLKRNKLLVKRLSELGMEISWAELETVGKKQIGRPHFARLMVQKGYVSSIREAFDHYLAEGMPAYVDRDEPSLEEAILHINRAGGIATLAHPGRISRDSHFLNTLVADLVPHGLRALECYHPEHTETDTRHCLAIAKEFDLAITGGSDYHGSYKPDLHLGSGKDNNTRIPFSLFLDFKARFTENGADARTETLSHR